MHKKDAVKWRLFVYLINILVACNPSEKTSEYGL